MAQVRRIYWGPQNGRVKCTFNSRFINQQSIVLVTASEGNAANTTASPARFVGAANFTVSNIAPADGAVVFVVNVDWGEPLNLWTDLVIMDEFPQGFIR